jgi:hypothetical protein
MQVFQWHAWFKTSCTSVSNDEHTGRPTSCKTPETVAQIQELNHQDRHQTIHNNTVEVGTGYGTSQQVLTKELGMHHVAVKFVPMILTADQMQQLFWQNTKWLSSLTHHTPLIWHPMTSSYFQK